MIIKNIIIESEIQEKVTKKHRIIRKEIITALLENKPKYLRSKEEKYMVLTHKERYLTIIFKYCNKTAEIITAYPSSKWQRRLYRKK